METWQFVLSFIGSFLTGGCSVALVNQFFLGKRAKAKFIKTVKLDDYINKQELYTKLFQSGSQMVVQLYGDRKPLPFLEALDMALSVANEASRQELFDFRDFAQTLYREDQISEFNEKFKKLQKLLAEELDADRLRITT